jgi:preprotein translocase subunit SecY
VVHTASLASSGQLNPLPLLLIVFTILAVTAFVGCMERAQRRITVNYA